MRSLGVIHARGGSKRIPRKNVKPLLGVPLVGWIAAAASASRIDRLIVSTDDREIAAAAEQWGASAPFLRPADISEDVASERVSQHALGWCEREFAETFDVVVTLQPTTPFATAKDIDDCIEALADGALNAAFTARHATQPPQWMLAIGADGQARPFLDGVIQGERGIVQSLPKLYLPNGAAYATRSSALREQNAILAHPMKVVVMSDERSVDLDEPLDWIVAEAVGRECGFKPVEVRRHV